MGGNSSRGGNGGNSYDNAQKARKAAVPGTKIGFKGTFKDDINPDNNTQTKKKNILEKIAEKSPTLNLIKMITKPGEEVNREYFDTKVKPSGKSKYNNYEDYIRARSKGEVDAYGREITQSDRDGPSQKSIEQPKVAAQMDNTEVKSDLITAKGPTSVEMSADDILLQNKKKGRKRTVLTSVTGVQGYPTLSKKTLLGG